MLPIFYFSSDLPFSPRWTTILNSAGYIPAIYNPEYVPPTGVILLFSPVLLEERWISYESVWKNYFEATDPEIRLIQAGIQGSKSTANYLHLYAWPDDLHVFLNTSKPVTDWTPRPTGGVDLNDQILLFFDGHGTDGFTEWKNKVQRVISGIAYKLHEGYSVAQIQHDLDEPEKRLRFSSMIGRWRHYRRLFSLLPNEKNLQVIDDLVEKMTFEALVKSPVKEFQQQIVRYQAAMDQIDEELIPLRKLIQKRAT
jgi:hypothetical protein